MNIKFVKAVKNSGITPYRLSKYSGVSYTIISELLTGKKDINKRAADTVLRLAKALDLEISDIMNPVYLLDGVSGKYRGVSYRWERQNDYMILSLKSRCLPRVEYLYWSIRRNIPLRIIRVFGNIESMAK